jgi:hypothetical protein
MRGRCWDSMLRVIHSFAILNRSARSTFMFFPRLTYQSAGSRSLRRAEVATLRYQNNICRFASSILLALGTLAPNPVASAPRSHIRFAPCPTPGGFEPPPCAHQTKGKQVTMDCAAPADYWFSSKTGLGCAGKVANIKLSMARIPSNSGYKNQYILTYNLYSGNGFQKDSSGFHIDAILANGNYIRDILGGRIEFDLSRCYYGKGQDFRIPSSGFPGVTNFDSTAANVFSLLIRVDPAIATGKNSHC